jgi:phosphoglycolate phosphatase-like HAD superfamily hydrolase
MLVFWDIDGTLLTTGRAGIFAWQEALADVAGVEADLWTFDTAGHPDFGIAERLLREVAGVPSPEVQLIRRLVEGYEARLPAALGRRTGRVLPHVREVLESLARDRRARSMLLTGNTRLGGQAKLRHYGLDGILNDGGFSDGPADRSAIAEAALARARELGSGTPADRVFVVGDTPHDVRCAATIHARSIAVATGAYGTDALAEAGAWKVFPELPPAPEFLALLTGREVAADA